MSDVEVVKTQRPKKNVVATGFFAKEQIFDDLFEKSSKEILSNPDKELLDFREELETAVELCQSIGERKPPEELLEVWKQPVWWRSFLLEAQLKFSQQVSFRLIFQSVWGALALAMAAVAVALFVPWHEMYKEYLGPTEAQEVLVSWRQVPPPRFESDRLPVVAKKPETSKASLKTVSEKRAEKLAQVTQVKALTKKQVTPKPPQVAVSRDVQKKKTVVSKPAKSVVAAVPKEKQKAKKAAGLQGFVYRAYMNLKNLDVITPKIADEIRGMGGKKAGSVNLGWRRNGGSYYHFTLPEGQYANFEKAIQKYGTVKIVKDRHKRVMPKGQLRFLLWIEDQNLKKK